MLFARFEFHPEHAPHFLDSRSQTTSELPFDSEDDLIMCLEGIQSYLVGCTVLSKELGRPKYYNLVSADGKPRPIPRKAMRKIATHLEKLYNMKCVMAQARK